MMKQSKTIDIDEVITASDHERGQTPRPDTTRTSAAEDMFESLRNQLGWKTRITLKLTQWFMFLRSRKWGKWVIVPVVILALAAIMILAVPAALCLFVYLIARKLFR